MSIAGIGETYEARLIHTQVVVPRPLHRVGRREQEPAICTRAERAGLIRVPA
jgi:hypothetical protein